MTRHWVSFGLVVPLLIAAAGFVATDHVVLGLVFVTLAAGAGVWWGLLRRKERRAAEAAAAAMARDTDDTPVLRYNVYAEWSVEDDGTLEVFISNVGPDPGSIVHILFALPAGDKELDELAAEMHVPLTGLQLPLKAYQFDLMNPNNEDLPEMPIRLAPGQAANMIAFPTAYIHPAMARPIRAGKARLVLVDNRSEDVAYPIPAFRGSHRP